MKNIIRIIFFLFLILFIGKFNALGCSCNTPTICQAYRDAQSIFVGKLEKIEQDESEKIYVLIASFSIEKTFKGTAKSIEQVRFKICEDDRGFEVGKRYFVYKENAKSNSACNPPIPLTKDDPNLEHAESLVKSPGGFVISGKISGLSEAELKDVQILIEKGEEKFKPILDKEGSFSLKTVQEGTYHVKILLPFQAKADVSGGYEIYEVKTLATPLKTILEYDLEFKSKECDFREFYITKIN